MSICYVTSPVGRLAIEADHDALTRLRWTSDDERARAVSPGQAYRFKIERADGKTLSWSVNNVEYFDLADPEPLTGAGHEHLGFNDWDAPVCFDNLKITPL